ncbi:Crp/Fnr family transcriptional regulator [Nocardioides pelophilus]|uniref:Crp/Fnr family transcriptional regulator n=1 Tax=Nocardioides pelophilus TaxID=2172019 RepID=UPI001601C7F5|nr:Crp/Fnr family transcriptional regulator [Nocardioides pelophilus]
MDPAWILLQTPLFGGLARGDVEELVPHLTEQRYDAGESVWIEGDRADVLLVIAEGMLKSHRLSRDGAEVIVAINAAVDATGEVGLFHRSRIRQVSVTAMAPTRCLLLRRQLLLDFLGRHPTALELMLEQIAGLTVRAAHSFTGLAFDDIRRRAARTLLALADEFGEPVAGGTRIRLELSQRTLAALVAASRENVNRALAPLVASGVISQQDGHFVVHDRDALGASADGL